MPRPAVVLDADGRLGDVHVRAIPKVDVRFLIRPGHHAFKAWVGERPWHAIVSVEHENNLASTPLSSKEPS